MTNALYQSIPCIDCGEKLLNLADFPFVIDPQYFKMNCSDSPILYAREGVIKKLLKIQQQLKDFRFKIWDAWRPRIVQNQIYQTFFDDMQKQHPDWDHQRLHKEVGVFVTQGNDKSRIPPHSTGGALDLTLVDKNGQELQMGTGFDHFGPESAIFYFDKIKPNSEISSNRKLLRESLMSEDFSSYEDEWWHFDYGNQLWALQKSQPLAIYGETNPEISITQ